MDKFLTKKRKESDNVNNDSSNKKTNIKEQTIPIIESNFTVITEPNDPKVVVFYNANSLLIRIDKNKDEIEKMIKENNNPDIICISEVRAAAFITKQTDRFKDRTKFREEKLPTSKNAMNMSIIKQSLESFGGEYKIHYSLSDKKYGGTCVAVKNNINYSWIAYCFSEAEKLYMQRLNINRETEEIYNMKNTQNSHTNADSREIAIPHYNDGRIIIMGFKTFIFIHTYSPNNGNNEESFTRRINFDNEMRLFLRRCHDNNQKIIWCGDLNIAPSDCDVTHPKFFSIQNYDNDDNNKGLPGFTINEQERFQEMLNHCNLVDSFRELHKFTEYSSRESHSHSEEQINSNNYSWRERSNKSRFAGKGMRIDHSIVSQSIMNRISEFKILGDKDLVGFCGSDHSPCKIVINDDV